MENRKIIKIDKQKCNGCGLCVDACHEGAIAMIGGKAQLMRDDYCDGLGDCLPVCPKGAISFEVRDALKFDKEAVLENMRKKNQSQSIPHSCPGSRTGTFTRAAAVPKQSQSNESRLMQWPVQIKLAPQNAAFFENADLLIAADCAAYAYANFHEDFMDGKITLIGCPKLDFVDYTDKLTAIIKENSIKSVTAVRMQVPCCGGLEAAVKGALQKSGKFIPWQVYTISTDGKILK